jgi:sodium-dependent dicarboxylate transporter 2/3/5
VKRGSSVSYENSQVTDKKPSSADLNAAAGLSAAARQSAAKFVGSLIVAAALAYLPAYPGLEPAGRSALFILLFAAGLWITEAIPAFAVALLAIGLEIAVLGRPGGVFATEPGQWTMFVAPWASPVIWLFFGGFVLASAANRTGLDRWLSRWVVARCGDRPQWILLGVMGITFVFSMFVSNTATTAAMIAMTTPLIASLPRKDPFAKALLLGVPFAAGLGGLGTIIGSPPNAIAHGALQGADKINFLQWMAFGAPPALVLFLVVWGFLLWRYRPASDHIDLSGLQTSEPIPQMLPLWQRATVMITFGITVGLWITGPLHGIPTPVVSFVPITIFTMTSVLGTAEIRSLQWDILLLLTGGLSLGVAVSETGLAAWMVDRLPVETLGPIGMALGLAYTCLALSNFMSNTAAANILIPIAAALGTSSPGPFVIPLALSASAAMCLPVSTPPNAIAFAQGRLQARDFLPGGLLVGVLAPVIAVFWCRWLMDTTTP